MTNGGGHPPRQHKSTKSRENEKVVKKRLQAIPKKPPTEKKHATS